MTHDSMNDFIALRLPGRATKYPRQRQNLLIRTTIYGDTHKLPYQARCRRQYAVVRPGFP